jgi:hypothetical protein
MDMNWVKQMAGLPINESMNADEEIIQALEEAVTDMPAGQSLDQMFATAASRLEAARRGLGLANKLKSREDKKKHRSTIMKALNSLRTLLGKISSELGDTKD